MTSNDRPKYQGWALILLGATALVLGGCGRKGPLDLPPTASSQPAAAVQSDPAAAQASKPSVFDPSYGANAPPTAPKGPKKPFVLDPLLNSN
ncbi:LPS translocon maturation chaperone LptM [Bradyrhizobium sp.]|uniref:LPS translocon maturation chaperone LptM n=1 Tax=Bradyrhizobium sp. TaxID=376 RepID=UPI003C733910